MSSFNSDVSVSKTIASDGKPSKALPKVCGTWRCGRLRGDEARATPTYSPLTLTQQLAATPGIVFRRPVVFQRIVLLGIGGVAAHVNPGPNEPNLERGVTNLCRLVGGIAQLLRAGLPL